MHEFQPVTETAVFIRTANIACAVGPLASTILAPRPGTVSFTDTSNCCEDCPDINDNPPSQSECPNFELEAGRWPICKREGNSDDMIGKFFGFGK